MTRNRKPNGFTLVESLVALSLGVAFLGSVVSAWTFTTKIWKEESVRSNLRVDIEQVMGRVKEDIRLSDGNQILFYPEDDTAYTAISLPRATANANGFYTLSNGNIVWDTTVIYHVFDNGGTMELRRTVIPSFNTNASVRQANLNTAALTGTVSGATTRVMFKAGTGTTFEIVPSNASFDGYASSVQRSENTSFGSIQLSPGAHTVTFQVVGQNPSSSGHGMGIDSFALTPSGCVREAEEVDVSADSGDADTNEVTTGFSSANWGGNAHKNYASNAVNDYITFDAYYDLWLEANFDNMTHSNTEIAGTDPHITLTSRETASIDPAWLASAQTAAATDSDETMLTAQCVRTVVNGQTVTNSANMVRFKFIAGATPLVISSAYVGPRSGREVDGDGTANFSGGPTQLYFDNPTVVEGSPDGTGAVGAGTATSVTIPGGSYIWTNWMEYDFTTGAAAPDLLISMRVSAGSVGQSWTDTSVTPPVHSYRVDDLGAQVTSSWDGSTVGYTESPVAFGAVQMAAWSNSGTATSQVYDTTMASPNFGSLTWDSTLPAGSSVTMKVRTSNNSDMTGATAWTALPDRTSSPSSLATLTSRRYVQFQAILQGASPYASFPEVDNVQITWPGQNAFVEVSGYYTKKPSYGQFRVLVDGQALTKRLEIKLTASQDYRGNTYESSLNAEAEPRNTGR